MIEQYVFHVHVAEQRYIKYSTSPNTPDRALGGFTLDVRLAFGFVVRLSLSLRPGSRSGLMLALDFDRLDGCHLLEELFADGSRAALLFLGRV